MRIVRAIRLAAPLFSRNIPIIQPKPITTPIDAIVLPKPFVTVLTQPVRVSTTAPSGPKGIARTAIMIAEIMSEGNACIFVKMISSIITTIPIAIANTG